MYCRCDHSYEDHQHIYYYYEDYEMTLTNDEVQRKLNSVSDEKEKQKIALEDIKITQAQLEEVMYEMK